MKSMPSHVDPKAVVLSHAVLSYIGIRVDPFNEAVSGHFGTCRKTSGHAKKRQIIAIRGFVAGVQKVQSNNGPIKLK